MANHLFSRRNFLSVLATTGAAGASAQIPADDYFREYTSDGDPALHSLSRVDSSGPRDPDQPIKILCTQMLSPEQVEKIKSAGKNLELHVVENSLDSARVEEAEVILGWADGATMRRAKKLKWVQVFAAGVENMPEELRAHPCKLTNMQRVFAPVIAESAIGLLLSLTRGLTQVSIPAFREKKWTHAPDDVALDDLYGKTIAIVGMGGIGSETARRLHYGFNMKVLATDPKPMPRPDFVKELRDPSWLMEMVPQADVLMSAAPLTKETRGMFNEQVFQAMKRTAYFINVSRGGLVDQPALVNALKSKKIRGAGIDVASPEPLPASDPLWTCPNLVITPHNSSDAPSRTIRLTELVVENMRRYSQDLPLLNVVDKQRGY
ncbi:MAG TPA: D-2-hydroxyacid dehydrogenase [Flavitalea sp.]|nr:D-2-hydroxyacid dehydrogenase [Flavitalea sp.]